MEEDVSDAGSIDSYYGEAGDYPFDEGALLKHSSEDLCTPTHSPRSHPRSLLPASVPERPSDVDEEADRAPHDGSARRGAFDEQTGHEPHERDDGVGSCLPPSTPRHAHMACPADGHGAKPEKEKGGVGSWGSVRDGRGGGTIRGRSKALRILGIV